MNILLFGAPGSGKGTQAVFLAEHFGLCHISTGDLFRTAIQNKTVRGLKAQSYIDQGKLVPDSVVVSLIRDLWTSSADIQNRLARGFVLDGFPRTVVQAESLSELLQSQNKTLDCVLFLTVEESILIARLTGRRVAEKSGQIYHIQFRPPKKAGICDQSGEKLIQRGDDKPEVVIDRLKTYRAQTTPLIEYYRQQNILTSVNGEGTPSEVFDRIKHYLAKNHEGNSS